MLPPSAQRLHAIGSWTLVVMGVAHAGGTLLDVVTPTFFVPREASVLEAMRASPVDLALLVSAPGMSVWRLHAGCSISMALGFAFVGALQLLLRRRDPSGEAATALVPLATAMSVGFAVIAAIFWFWVPCAGFVIAAACLALTWRARAPPAATRPARPLPSLLLRGALLMGIAGTLHGLATLVELVSHGVFTPAAAGVRAAMASSDLALPAMFGRHTSTWQAYVGFNLGHGLAVAGFAIAAWAVARRAELDGDRAVVALFAAASCLWLSTAVAFWFYAPIAATAVATIAHATLLARLARRGASC